MELCDYPKMEKCRFYEIEAIEIPIVYNRYGDHDPNGLLYVLKKDARRIKEKALQHFKMDPPQPYKEVQPLVIRANVGDKICISFTHSLKRALSIHVQGLRYDVQTSDGASVGFNKDSTTTDKILYTWYADKEGVYSFQDMGDTRSSEKGTNVHGLFGAIIVEAAESTWLDPETGEELESGLFADIYHPVRPAFREYAVFFHDELEIKNKEGEQPIDPHTGLPSSTTAISYRAEPMRNRPPLTAEHSNTGEDISMSSWVYGDPAPPILRAYVGDPSKIRLIHGGVKETHVFHLHNHQWRLEGENPNSTIIDSISISPQECYTLDILHGAGSLNRTIGDVIFHCHLYPHFHEGMWTLWRIHDRLEDGTGTLPDGTVVPPLMPLKDRVLPPKKDLLHPGYPNFIDGTVGEPPLQPPLGVLKPDGGLKTEPTELERANFVEGFQPGALYCDTCPCHTDECCEKCCCEKVRVFELALVQAKVIYNSYGWHDPQGRFFVMKEELEKHGGLEAYIQKVEEGKLCAEPLVIRANAGDCIEIRLTNLLPEFLEESPFQMMTRTDIVGYHIHLVKFDTIVSDGAANGWNNIAGARRYETLIERFFLDTELRTVFFHDHLFANSHQQHGVFGALFVPLEEADMALCGDYEPKPLILRANAGEWIEVTLHNLFDVHKPIQYFDYPRVPLDVPHKPSMRVSLNPQFLYYDPVCDSGINVGYNNREQTVGPGESKKYLWYADQEYGACMLQSFGDMRNHRYHGLFGAIIIEPPGAKWYRSFSFAEALHEEEIVVTAPGVKEFRECVVMIQNGIRMLDKEGNLIQTTVAGEEEEPDAEDTGEKGYNYRSERFANRLKKDGRISKVFSSRVHGDPATPVFKAYTGERVIFRTMMPADKPRNVSFVLHGNIWREQPADPFSRMVPMQGAVSIGNTFHMELKEAPCCPGDYLYRSGSLKWDVESGMWGIFRILKHGIKCKCRNVCKKIMDCVHR